MTTPIQAEEARLDPAVDYLRRVYGHVFEWYRIADTKGQVLLSVDGILVTVLGGAVFGEPEKIAQRTGQFGWETWFLLALAGLSVVGSIGAAVMCLRSRLADAHIDRVLHEFDVDPSRPETYNPRVAWWFGTLARLERAGTEHLLRRADQSFEADALSSEVWLLSRNVLTKHRWANTGWLLTAFVLVSLVATAASYVARA
jgi:hypothetical protein